MNIRKAILTGGGHATRLYPITTTINKHLLPLANKPMIFHAIEKVVEAGITDIFINTNPGEIELQKHIGDGGHWGVRIRFFEQEGGPQGIAHVVKQAQDFIGDDPFIFYLSDNILLGSLKDIIQDFRAGSFDCMLALSRVEDPERFGIPYFNESKELIDVVEKPSKPPNNLAVTGIYLYGPKVFFEAFDHIKKSPRGEYEISSIHSHFLKTGRRVGYKEITGWWKDTGKVEDLLLANQLLLDCLPEKSLALSLNIHKDAKIKGIVHIGLGSVIGQNTEILGPVIIGENCVLENCSVGPNVTLGPGVELLGPRIQNSIILANSSIQAPLGIKDSIIGRQVQIRRLDSDTQSFVLGDKSILNL
ncbi:MAG: glucose-1-phosphate thymidylyltransferase [Candidatus Magasanikbacteria bacterium]|nr:glucose-1-phosphate thymidylyltransferase [Candidatus Magasanikbacteria bacterium]